VWVWVCVCVCVCVCLCVYLSVCVCACVCVCVVPMMSSSQPLCPQVNCNDDDRGVLLGKWTAGYEGGVSPLSWGGSAEILRRWDAAACQPVRYGQCWVFAAVACSGERAAPPGGRSRVLVYTHTTFRSVGHLQTVWCSPLNAHFYLSDKLLNEYKINIQYIQDIDEVINNDVYSKY